MRKYIFFIFLCFATSCWLKADDLSLLDKVVTLHSSKQTYSVQDLLRKLVLDEPGATYRIYLSTKSAKKIHEKSIRAGHKITIKNIIKEVRGIFPHTVIYLRNNNIDIHIQDSKIFADPLAVKFKNSMKFSGTIKGFLNRVSALFPDAGISIDSASSINEALYVKVHLAIPKGLSIGEAVKLLKKNTSVKLNVIVYDKPRSVAEIVISGKKQMLSERVVFTVIGGDIGGHKEYMSVTSPKKMQRGENEQKQ